MSSPSSEFSTRESPSRPFPERHVDVVKKKQRKKRSNLVGSGRRAQPDHKIESQVKEGDLASPAEDCDEVACGFVVGKTAGCDGRFELMDTARRRGSPGDGTTWAPIWPALLLPMMLQRHSAGPSNGTSGGGLRTSSLKVEASCQCEPVMVEGRSPPGSVGIRKERSLLSRAVQEKEKGGNDSVMEARPVRVQSARVLGLSAITLRRERFGSGPAEWRRGHNGAIAQETCRFSSGFKGNHGRLGSVG